jgi:hypothetical protein
MTTPNFNLPLDWSKYPSDRALVAEALERIDTNVHRALDVLIGGLPTSDPGIAGRIYVVDGVLMVSEG